MLMPKKKGIAIYDLPFKEGVMAAKNTGAGRQCA